MSDEVMLIVNVANLACPGIHGDVGSCVERPGKVPLDMLASCILRQLFMPSDNGPEKLWRVEDGQVVVAYSNTDSLFVIAWRRTIPLSRLTMLRYDPDGSAVSYTNPVLPQCGLRGFVACMPDLASCRQVVCSPGETAGGRSSHGLDRVLRDKELAKNCDWKCDMDKR